jgi:hypothetical protein
LRTRFVEYDQSDWDCHFLPCIRVGRRILVPKAALDKLLEGT